jgi:hypothetical protein
VCYFYCDYKDVEKQKPVNILGAIAVQLALRSELAFGSLEQYHQKLHPGPFTELTPNPEDLCRVVEQMMQEFDSTTLVVDGLDECLQQAPVVTSLLVSLQATGADKVRVALISRDEQYIRNVVDQAKFSSLSIAADKTDLSLYVAAEMKQRMADGRLRVNNKDLEELIIERLVNEAQGI